eukprot:CAMPEP_0170431534 /NCGR_PEP_ID=MMETSP0117_2-20130122/41454_1 /TAXON_ID=400756 /ORGANISM="Durinskia baltica, Strain CSIRO CS-38" /LENGTH=187 /DNA_ID=CAMNT_0010691099 /DNA_START=58 /DNA_END=619 /DNA_ORIENTATION=-
MRARGANSSGSRHRLVAEEAGQAGGRLEVGRLEAVVRPRAGGGQLEVRLGVAGPEPHHQRRVHDDVDGPEDAHADDVPHVRCQGGLGEDRRDGQGQEPRPVEDAPPPVEHAVAGVALDLVGALQVGRIDGEEQEVHEDDGPAKRGRIHETSGVPPGEAVVAPELQQWHAMRKGPSMRATRRPSAATI